MGIFIFSRVPVVRAVDFYDGVRAPRGLYFLPYTIVYWADKTTDSNGHTSNPDYDLIRASQLIRLSYYSPEFVFNILLPFGYTRVGYFDESSSGLGDIWVGAGAFLPIKEVDLLLMVNTKLPTGEYNSEKTVNYGSNQLDVGPSLFIHKTTGKFSFDGAIKYYFKLENHATDTKPGNTLHLQMLLGYEFTRGIKVGPGVNWMLGENKKVEGENISKSDSQRLSVGGESYFKIGTWSITLNYLTDVYSENSAMGHFFKIKLCHKF